MDDIKSFVLGRLTGQTPTPLTNLITEYGKLHSLLAATIERGEGNSILLLGSRGVGKSCLVETVVADLASEHAEEFHLVRLNGFLQTDDKLALYEIWRQLGREMQVDEEETAQVSNYADTMASLLHLLSHPEEWADALDPDGAEGKTSNSVIFILDEFDLFTGHPRQTLLYNLFEIAQARKAPVAVIGCSARVDVIENLEKRVKSRFSHRWVHLPQAKSLVDFEQILEAALVLREQDRGPNISRSLYSEWNAFIKTSFLPSAHVKEVVQETFYTTKSIPDLFSNLYIEVAAITLLDHYDAYQPTSSTLRPPDSILGVLPHLPSLHLALLISATRLDAIHNATVFTFSLVYNHYTELVSRAQMQASAAGSIAQASKVWDQDVATGAWEELVEWEIILSAPGKGLEGPETRLWRCDVVLEEIIGAVGGAAAGMSDMMIRWCKEV